MVGVPIQRNASVSSDYENKLTNNFILHPYIKKFIIFAASNKPPNRALRPFANTKYENTLNLTFKP